MEELSEDEKKKFDEIIGWVNKIIRKNVDIIEIHVSKGEIQAKAKVYSKTSSETFSMFISRPLFKNKAREKEKVEEGANTLKKHLERRRFYND